MSFGKIRVHLRARVHGHEALPGAPCAPGLCWMPSTEPSSSAYLRAVYGAFGAGASIASLLIAGMVFELLGLYPALRLRALLRREVRGAVRIGRSRAARAALAIALLPAAVGLCVDRVFRLDPRPPVPEAALGQALAVVRASIEGKPLPSAPALAGVDPGDGPLTVTLWHEGARVARAAGRGRDL